MARRIKIANRLFTSYEKQKYVWNFGEMRIIK